MSLHHHTSPAVVPGPGLIIGLDDDPGRLLLGRHAVLATAYGHERPVHAGEQQHNLQKDGQQGQQEGVLGEEKTGCQVHTQVEEAQGAAIPSFQFRG